MSLLDLSGIFSHRRMASTGEKTLCVSLSKNIFGVGVLKQVALPANELSGASVRMEACVMEQLDGMAAGCKLSDKSMRALDRLKSLEGGDAGKTCEASPVLSCYF